MTKQQASLKIGIPEQQIRASFSSETIRVYQAYNDDIADSALANGTFVSPPFKMSRMTWIKPSFLWMMYRSGWGMKDSSQSRILALDISHEGFNWALANSCLSHYSAAHYSSNAEWTAAKEASPVRIQWDPERDLLLNKLDYRSIQVGLTNEAVPRYANEWIKEITDITPLAHQINNLIQANMKDEAIALLPKQRPYTIDSHLSLQAAATLQI
jgi:hypothetical protein